MTRCAQTRSVREASALSGQARNRRSGARVDLQRGDVLGDLEQQPRRMPAAMPAQTGPFNLNILHMNNAPFCSLYNTCRSDVKRTFAVQHWNESSEYEGRQIKVNPLSALPEAAWRDEEELALRRRKQTLKARSAMQESSA